ncbi:mannose-1-phosphate guanylyltransferase/mannose-6-phosphate isomerase [Ruegeria pomeroyi]|nr:mannose-1-phosphate guanylyltransferase/mannose-6-phosphate isomerase [Ruegeria pomeroyi]
MDAAKFKDTITPVILCGGSGTRLWPLSRRSYPKQFANLIGDSSLFQDTARRMSGPGFAAPLILTNSDFRFIATQQLLEIGIDPGAVLLEPSGRNTAAAILAAALWMRRQGQDGLMLVAPSDHAIPDTAAFHDMIARGAEAAAAGQLVTFGVVPDRAETGYGYLELSHPPAAGDRGPVPLARFVEKPDAENAARMLASGRHLWNAGLFLFSPAAILAAFEAHMPAMLEQVGRALDEGHPDLGFFRLAPEPWDSLEDISIDYAVMEKAGNLSAVPFDHGWSDLGGWDAVWREMAQSGDGVALSGTATAIDCENSMLRSEDDNIELVGIGLNNIVAIAMADAVLVADASRSQDVKQAVTALKRKEARQAETFRKDHRPWGWFESLVLGERFQVKRIMVHPGAALSLQSHHHRSEHWIVVEGTARVTVDDTVTLVTENQSIYVPLGAVHRMENPGKVPMVLIEIQTGTYLGEDDIIRYEDVYARQ